MSDAPETAAPAPSPGLIDRLAAAIAAITNTTPAPEPDAALNALQASFDTLQADHQALTDAATLAAEKLEGIQAELTTAQGKLETATNALATVDAALPGLSASADPKAFFTAAVTTSAQEQIAASGFKPNEAPGVDAQDRSDDTKTRAEFAALTPQQQSEFSKAGGKLKD